MMLSSVWRLSNCRGFRSLAGRKTQTNYLLWQNSRETYRLQKEGCIFWTFHNVLDDSCLFLKSGGCCITSHADSKNTNLVVFLHDLSHSGSLILYFISDENTKHTASLLAQWKTMDYGPFFLAKLCQTVSISSFSDKDIFKRGLK